MHEVGRKVSKGEQIAEEGLFSYFHKCQQNLTTGAAVDLGYPTRQSL